MKVLKRIFVIAFAVLTLLTVALMIAFPEFGYYLMMGIISISLLVKGIKYLVYYFRMAKYMVNGKEVLYRGLIFTNIGVFTTTVADIPQIFIMIYLLGLCSFLGFVSIMRALEMRKNESKWKLKFSEGIVYVAIALFGLIFITYQQASVYIYCAGLIYSSIMRIVNLFAHKEIVYVQ